MADGLNEVRLIGNLGKDSELRSTQSGRSVLRWSMATTRTWNDDAGKKQEATEWHNCSLWGKRAEALAKYMTKGSRVHVSGRIEYRNSEDKDGTKRYYTDIQVLDVILLGGGSGGQRRDDAEPQEPRGPSSNGRREREEQRIRPGSDADDKPPF